MAIIQPAIESKNDSMTFVQNSECPSLQAIDHFTRLFDITARSIVLEATPKVISPLSESTAIA
jgi:hypothetical protein